MKNLNKMIKELVNWNLVVVGKSSDFITEYRKEKANKILNYCGINENTMNIHLYNNFAESTSVDEAKMYL